MTIIELINKVGMENVKVQPLHQSLVRMHAKKDDTELTFATSHECGDSVTRQSQGMDGQFIGLVLWIPADKAKA